METTMVTTAQPRSRGLGTEMARAIGWLVLRAGVAKLPETRKATATATGEERAPREAELPPLMMIAASIVGVVLALVPRGSIERTRVAQ